MYKKILAICLSVVIIMSTAIVPAFADSFNLVLGNDESTSVTSIARADRKDKDNGKDKDNAEDILKLFLDSKDIKWAEKAIEKLGAMGILSGVGNGFFKPSKNVSHVEAIAMVIKLLGQKEEADAIDDEPEYFKNKCDEWSYGYLQLALDNGIIIPAEDGKFNPKTPAKRHEIAKYIVRALGMRDEALANMSASLSFNDSSSIPKNSVGYVYVISKLGIMQGNNNNEFQPNKPITRAEMAVLLDRAEGKFDDTFDNDNEFDGIFLSYDSTNSRITMKVNNKEVVYNVIPNAPVYKNNTYYTMSVLQPGDLIEIVLDSSNRIIFIEFKEVGTVPPSTGERLSFRHMEYSALSAELKALIDNLKLTENYVAYKQGQYIYLITSKGQMTSVGYTISVKEVYRETVQNGKYNLRAVVETTSPASSMITPATTFPYDVVRLSYFNGIDKVNFVRPDNDLIEQTSLVSVNDFEVITGKITSIDTTNRIIYFNDANNTAKAYYISTNAQITLNNSAAALSALAANMPVTVTVSNGYAIKIAAQSTDAINTVSGTITSVDTVNKILYLKDINNISRAYSIASNAVVTLNNSTVALSSLTANMPVTVTLTNGYATRIAAQSTDAIETIVGTITSVDTVNRIIYLKDTSNNSRAYYIASNAVVTLNNSTVALSSLTANMPVTVTLTNGYATRIAAQNANSVQVINGTISSVDTSNRILYLKDTNNTSRVYYIPSNAEITLNNTAVAITSLTANMPAAVTLTNNIVTKVAARNADRIVTINGKIVSVDIANRIIYVKESDNVTRAYYIAATVQITLDGKVAALSALTENMTLTITRTNDVITSLSAQTVADTEIINGKISSINAANRLVYVKEADNVIRPYYIPANVLITLNNTAVALSALQENMNVAITRVSGEITKLAATQSVEVINGTIDSIDTTNRIVKLLESNNIVSLYTIPANAQILLNSQATDITQLTKGMKAEITKVDSEIIKLSAQNDVQLIEGVLINVYPSQSNSTISVKVGSTYKLYVLMPETAVFYDNQSIAIQDMPLNITITIKLINGVVTEVRNK